MALQNRCLAGRHGELTAMSRFSDAAELWLSKVDAMVEEGRRSPGTVETYRRQLRNPFFRRLERSGWGRPPRRSFTR